MASTLSSPFSSGAVSYTHLELGIELFVLDDGWFGKRDDDTTSLGDWYPNLHKLPDGITGLAGKIRDMGMKFGLWFEPEMVSRDSCLYLSLIHIL